MLLPLLEVLNSPLCLLLARPKISLKAGRGVHPALRLPPKAGCSRKGFALRGIKEISEQVESPLLMSLPFKTSLIAKAPY
jgi:hypothetical protein